MAYNVFRFNLGFEPSFQLMSPAPQEKRYSTSKCKRTLLALKKYHLILGKVPNSQSVASFYHFFPSPIFSFSLPLPIALSSPLSIAHFYYLFPLPTFIVYFHYPLSSSISLPHLFHRLFYRPFLLLIIAYFHPYSMTSLSIQSPSMTDANERCQ